MKGTPPFIVYALPRSRTAWLSKFLSYREWRCYHEQAIYMRSVDDIKEIFSCPNTGVAETAAAQGRYLIRHAAPNIREVVVFRPVEEVVDSMMKADVSGMVTYDRHLLKKGMSYSDRVLHKIAKDKNVLSINYHDMDNPEICARIFEHCLPYSFDKIWWESLKDKNIQADIKAILRYYYKYRESVELFKRLCKSELFRLRRMDLSSLRMN